ACKIEVQGPVGDSRCTTCGCRGRADIYWSSDVLHKRSGAVYGNSAAIEIKRSTKRTRYAGWTIQYKPRRGIRTVAIKIHDTARCTAASERTDSLSVAAYVQNRIGGIGEDNRAISSQRIICTSLQRAVGNCGRSIVCQRAGQRNRCAGYQT